MSTNIRIYLKKMVYGLLALLLVSCTDSDLGETINGGDSSKQLCAISEIGTQTVSFNLKYDVPEGYRVAFEVYKENPVEINAGMIIKKVDVSPILTGVTNGKGEYDLSRSLSEQVKEVYVYSSYIGVPPLLYGKIENGTVVPEEIEFSESAETKAISRASNNFPFYTLGGWNSLGKPDYVSKTEKISSSVLQAVNKAFPEWKKANPEYNNRTDIYVEKDAEIWISMLHSGSLFDNVLGYFTYEGDIKNVDPNSIHEIIAFPRANIVRLFSSGLKAGDAVQLKYYNSKTGKYQTTFPKGTSIGWVIRTDGYSLLRRSVNEGLFRFYSYPEWNPESGNKNHTVLFKKDNFVVVGFEDLPNEWINYMKGDGDCNDLMFHVSSYPEDAISYEIPEIPDGGGDIDGTEEVDGIQPLSEILDLPDDDPFWSDLFVASKSTYTRKVSDNDAPESYGSVIGVKDELIIANSKTMESLIVDQGPSIYRAFVKTTIRKIATKADPPKKKKFVKTTIRGMIVYIEVDDYDDEYMGMNAFSLQRDVRGTLIQKINSAREQLQNNIPVRIIVEMEFEPVPEKEFIEILPVGPYSPFCSFNGE